MKDPWNLADSRQARSKHTSLTFLRIFALKVKPRPLLKGAATTSNRRVILL